MKINITTSIVFITIMIIALICPCLLAVMFSVIVLIGGWDKLGWIDHTNQFFFIHRFQNWTMVFVYLAICVIFILGIYFCFKRINKNDSTLLNCALLFLVSSIIRISLLIYILAFYGDLAPFSDFKQTWDIANGNMESLPYKSLFAAWMNYANLERVMVIVFGNNYHSLLIINCIMSSISVPLIYLICRKLDDDISIIASLLYSFYPSSMLFTMIASPDILVVPLYLMSILLIMDFELLSSTNKKGNVLISVLAGVFVGMSSAYKSFGIVVIIAYIIMIAVLSTDETKKDHFQRKRLYRYGYLLICLSCVLVSYKITKEYILSRTERDFSIELNYSDATPHYLLVGLNTEGEGQIHIGNQSRLYYQSVINDGLSLDKAKELAYSTIINDWKENDNIIFNLFIPKTIWAWQDDTIPIQYINQSIQSEDSISDGIDDATLGTVSLLLQVSYCTIMLLSLLGVIHSIILGDKVKKQTIFIILIVIGYFSITLISEAQSRYKYIIMPLLCIIASVGLKSVANFAKHYIHNSFRRIV